MHDDIYFIKRTFRLARRAQGFTSPNPLVGALIVKDNKIIAEGYHKGAGLPHAEIEAMRGARQKDFRGSTLYVNLEPCLCFGRTPPCVDEIIKKKFKRVVVSSLDPNSKVNGKSIKKLSKAGIKTEVGLLAEEAKRLNEVFFKNMQKGLPFVVIKTAQSLDGKIATRMRTSKWITSEASRKFAKSLRDRYDAVLVGINTVIKDNPRLEGIKKIPYKVVIDPGLRMPLNSNILKENAEKLIIFASKKKAISKKQFSSSAKIFFMKEKKGQILPREILRVLYDLGIMSVFIEGGSKTIGGFFDERVVDKVHFFIAPKIIGGDEAIASVGGQGQAQINNLPYLKDVKVRRLDQDILISGYPSWGRRGTRDE